MEPKKKNHHPRRRTDAAVLARRVLVLAVLLLSLTSPVTCASSSSHANNGIILRIRLGDGSMEKVQIPSGKDETMTLSDILKPFDVEEKASIQTSTGPDKQKVEDTSLSLSQLGLKHGSMITIVAPPKPKPTESRFSQLKPDPNQWDPFPDLAKDYRQATLKIKTRRSNSQGMSYGDLARLQSALHVLEPQPEGPLKRVYMCSRSAERFQANGLKKGEPKPLPRLGLLLGSIQTERVEMKPKKARTSLSSQTMDSDFCTVAKVQCIWEPPSQKASSSNAGIYDPAMGEKLLDANPQVLKVAKYLGLVPVGWIFSYRDNRHEDDDALPIHGQDVQTGATLQCKSMKTFGRQEGKKFCTLAMDGNTGATEAFQLSDVSVQMVAEGLLKLDDGKDIGSSSALSNIGRHIKTKHEIIVDGKETKKLDSVLCLVNTAMLAHTGSYSGTSAASSVKKNGGLLNKSKKALLKVMDDDSALLPELCDFSLLLALSQLLAPAEAAELCQTVRKWARGQKRGTTVSEDLKRKLKSILET